MEMTAKQQNQLISELLIKLEKQFAEPVTELETHISTILLVADKAFKIKKPVDFGFLDFSTLEKRHFYCREELRLNSRLAPGLYEKVLPITGTVDEPTINEQGEALEYMIQMQRFEQHNELDHLLENDQLTQAHIDSLAEIIAGFHQSIPTADETADYVQPEAVQYAVQENFDQINPLLEHVPEETRQQIKQLEQWAQQRFKQLKPIFRQRLHEGFIRECHGDMHLRNITIFEDNITIFDGIEFNNAFRWIDVISELAFLLMDLQYREKYSYAFRLLNRYLEITGDYAGLQLLHFYQVYRAMVRAKVSALRLSQMQQDSEEYSQLQNSIINHVNLAHSYTQETCRFLMITHGVSGSGKSYTSQQIIEQHGAIRIRSDVERIRMYADTQTRYSKDATEKTYAKILELGELVSKSGYSVILDATYLKIKYRQAVQQRAKELNCPYLILDMQCEVEEMERRIRQRMKDNQDASEADIEILHQQLRTQEPLMDEEKEFITSYAKLNF